MLYTFRKTYLLNYLVLVISLVFEMVFGYPFKVLCINLVRFYVLLFFFYNLKFHILYFSTFTTGFLTLYYCFYTNIESRFILNKCIHFNCTVWFVVISIDTYTHQYTTSTVKSPSNQKIMLCPTLVIPSQNIPTSHSNPGNHWTVFCHYQIHLSFPEFHINNII